MRKVTSLFHLDIGETWFSISPHPRPHWESSSLHKAFLKVWKLPGEQNCLDVCQVYVGTCVLYLSSTWSWDSAFSLEMWQKYSLTQPTNKYNKTDIQGHSQCHCQTRHACKTLCSISQGSLHKTIQKINQDWVSTFCQQKYYTAYQLLVDCEFKEKVKITWFRL